MDMSLNSDDWEKIEKIYHSAKNGGYVLDCYNNCCFHGDTVVDSHDKEYTLLYNAKYHCWFIVDLFNECKPLKDKVIKLA